MLAAEHRAKLTQKEYEHDRSRWQESMSGLRMEVPLASSLPPRCHLGGRLGLCNRSRLSFFFLSNRSRLSLFASATVLVCLSRVSSGAFGLTNRHANRPD